MSECGACDGSGQFLILQSADGGEYATCPWCNGTGIELTSLPPYQIELIEQEMAFIQSDRSLPLCESDRDYP
ncbi:hypothetical protein [Roseofilum sp. Belize Diploria]|uniref:hypothetical protein n=1 Tax=Roseofilum sp. Belize Diploria TaxID=2821501 RepID=UPI000E9AA0CF|nr:hypothetical protein [Roseofilum sp. Belize Diploria]MBP0011086.1 hypothetical protein [Roseofilum sp. Belize Diploria]HBQ97567.1 hypothetical protein [Cyanobacteria bacterium UBA11691]